MPPTYFYLGIVLIILMHFIFPIIQIIHYPYTLIGILLIIFGMTLNFLAWLLFIKNKTTQNPFNDPNKFIVKGTYKISRNPMYLGMASTLFGAAIFLGSLISFIFPIIFVYIIRVRFIHLEEKNMEKKFGKKYVNYKNSVRRWI